MNKTPEAEPQIDAPSDAKQLDALAPTRKSRRKSILALSVFALGLNATAAVYTLSPSDFALPNVSSLAELLPYQKASDPTPDPVIAALKDIQSAQQSGSSGGQTQVQGHHRHHHYGAGGEVPQPPSSTTSGSMNPGPINSGFVNLVG